MGGGGGGGGGGSSAVDGSSHVNVMLSSLSSGSLNAFRMDSVKWRYPSGPGRTSKLHRRETGRGRTGLRERQGKPALVLAFGFEAVSAVRRRAHLAGLQHYHTIVLLSCC